MIQQIESIEPPTIYDTVLFKLPLFFYNKSIGRFIGSKHEAVLDDQEGDSLFANGHDAEEDAINEATALNANGEAKRRKPKIRQGVPL
jgi:hypothetical protein